MSTNCSPYVERISLGVRNKLIIALLFDTGLRASELCSVDVETDLDLAQSTIHVRHGKGDKPRVVPFGASTGKMLRKYIAVRGELDTDRLIVSQFGSPVDRDVLREIIVRIGKRAGIQVTTHQLRHSCAVALIKAGCDVFTVQRLLGHSTLVMTRRYSNLADVDVMDRHRQFSPSDRLGNLKNVGRKKIR